MRGTTDDGMFIYIISIYRWSLWSFTSSVATGEGWWRPARLSWLSLICIMTIFLHITIRSSSSRIWFWENFQIILQFLSLLLQIENMQNWFDELIIQLACLFSRHFRKYRYTQLLQHEIYTLLLNLRPRYWQRLTSDQNSSHLSLFLRQWNNKRLIYTKI